MAIERYQPNTVGPTTDFNTGQGTLADEIGRAGYTAEKIAEDWGGKLRAKAGEDAGAAAGESLNVDTKITSGMNEFTAYGQAYTNAAEAAYSARTKTDMIGTIDRLKMENETDPIAFATKAQGAMDGLVQNADPRIQPFLKLFARAQITSGQAEIAGKVHEWNLQQGVADTLDSNRQSAKAVAEAAKGKTPAEVDALVIGISDSVASEWHALANSHAVHPVIAEQHIQEFHKQLEAEISGERVGTVVEDLLNVFHADANVGAQKFAAIMDQNNKSYTGEEKAAIGRMWANGVEADHHLKSMLPQNIAAANKVATDIAGGGYGAGLIARVAELRRQNVFTPLEQQAHVVAIERNRISALDTGTKFAAVDDMLNDRVMPGDPGGPGGAEYKKYVSANFDQTTIASKVAPGSDRWVQMATLYANKTNVVPLSVESWIRTSAMSHNAAQASIAANTYEKLKDANKVAAMFQSDPKMDPLLSQMSEFTRNGQSAEAAYEMAMKNTYDQTDGQRQILNEQYKPKGDTKRNQQNAKELQDFINTKPEFTYPGSSSWFSLNSGHIKPSVDNLAIYDKLRRDAYVATGGNDQAAKDIATRAFSANYAVSTVNGYPELLKNAPEIRYPYLKPEVINAYKEQELQRIGWHPKFDNVTPQFPPAVEDKYRMWLEKIGQTPDQGMAVDRNGTGMDYDLRAFYAKYGPVDVVKGQHLTDEFKLPNHKTFSNESIFAAGDYAKYAGRWVGEGDNAQYVPSKTTYAAEHRVELANTIATDFTNGRVWALVDKNGNVGVTQPNGKPYAFMLPVGPDFATRVQQAKDKVTRDAASLVQAAQESAAKTAASDKATAGRFIGQ